MTTTNIYYKICRAIYINKIPLEYKSNFLKDNNLSDEHANLLLIRYEIDINKIKKALEYLDRIKDNEKEMFDFFCQIWKHK